MQKHQHSNWWLRIILVVGLALSLGQFSATTTTVQAATEVYVTRTGHHYFYSRHDRGLNRVKKVYRVSLSTAKSRGLTLAGTAVKKSKPAPKKVVHHKAKKRPVKKSPKKSTRKSTKRVAKKRQSTKSKAVTYHAVTRNANRPTFSKTTLSLKHGAWATYGNLDGLNRATTANALLNRRLMPTQKRAPLIVNPTGWHNKKFHGEWLFNRCHLIGYQLTGQNNNLKNLITGTRSLNDPGMTKYENQVAKYLKASRSHYVRYQVKPIFDGHNLLATGVQMQAASIGSKAIRFNVYLPNTEAGVQLNYANGTSRVK